jgi:hypothetical protein
MEVGDVIWFVDAVAVSHRALVTNVFDNGQPTSIPNPAVNLVFVSDDKLETDQYGRQIKRNTSVVHKLNQSAHGSFWHRTDEVG